MATVSRRILALLLVSALTLAGCVSPDLAEWGEDGIEVSVDNSAMTATLSTHLGEDQIVDNVVNLTGCDSEGYISLLYNSSTEYQSKQVSIEGWLTRTKHFPNGVDGVGNAEKMSASAVIIQLNSYDDAESPDMGRLDGVKWVYPTSGVKAKPPLEGSSSSFPHSGWAVVGLVPANEEILKGFGGLDPHQKISLKGWFMSDTNYPFNPEVTGNCRIYAGGSGDGGFSGSMLVTQITLEKHGVISESDPYDAFAVSPIGSAAYFLLILVSFGGALLLFLLSSGLIRRGAKLSAKELLTEAQLLAARGVKKDLSQVLKDIEKETGEGLDVKAKKAEVIKAEKLSSKPEVELDDFDIDSVLRENRRPDARSIRGVESGGVVTTDESISMDETIADREAEMEEDAEWVRSGGRGGRGGGRGGGSGTGEDTLEPDEQTGSMAMEKGEAAKPKIRKTRSVKKKSEPEPEPEPVNRGPDITDDEDFSDFSL
uniref:Uncharacterized protein n=1 Tax=uncultured marine group II/III euryarchaeote KM3_178_D06 TaxID=1457940 RepID=A0A075GRY8_9EURY|nr:hypothetical protein [uncultured marine group II/III euryarchaeote KM3_178_D06]